MRYLTTQEILTVTHFPASRRWTNALEVADAVDAGPSVSARVRSALVDIYSTVGTGEALCALAQEPVDAVNALSSVVAGLRDAVIDVVLAVVPFESVSANALVVVASVDAGSTIEAGVRTTGDPFSDVTSGSCNKIFAVIFARGV